MSVRKPPHDVRLAGPLGDSGRTRGVIIHTTEGVSIPDSRSDRHRVIDYLADVRGLSVPAVADTDGSTQMVPDGHHGEHAACVDGCYGVEIIGTARWSTEEWKAHDDAVRNAARWAAYWLAEEMGLPVNPRTLRDLVVGHDRDHVFGGCSDHWDPGPRFPWDRFRLQAMSWATEKGYRVTATKGDLRRVRHYRAPALRRALAWAGKRLKAGYSITIRRERLQLGDLS